MKLTADERESIRAGIHGNSDALHATVNLVVNMIADEATPDDGDQALAIRWAMFKTSALMIVDRYIATNET